MSDFIDDINESYNLYTSLKLNDNIIAINNTIINGTLYAFGLDSKINNGLISNYLKFIPYVKNVITLEEYTTFVNKFKQIDFYYIQYVKNSLSS